MLDFNSLSSTKFEEFCYDALKKLWFFNLEWRKGTGYDTSPSDSWRDIEAYVHSSDPDWFEHTYKWFIDAKHYKKGVPVSDIQNIINRARAEKPNTVLIICSSDLTNWAKQWVEKYIQNERPYFRIRYWQNKDLEEIVTTHPQLLEKYNLLVN
jgi:hypothetical protein